MPLIFTAESQGLEQHRAQSGCLGSDHLGYTLQTPSGASPSPDHAHQPPRKMLDPFLQGALMTERESEMAQLLPQGYDFGHLFSVSFYFLNLKWN